MAPLIAQHNKAAPAGGEVERSINVIRRESHMEQKVDIRLDSEALDNAIEKANRLAELLREVQQIVDSLSGAEKSEA